MEESRRLKRGKKENGFILILSGNAMTRSRQTYVAALKQPVADQLLWLCTML